MLFRRRTCAVALGAALAVAVAAAPSATAHPPTQHQEQMRLAGTAQAFDLNALVRSAVGAKCEDGQAGPYPCKDVDLASFVPLAALGGATGNDIWGWTDSETGREYAIVGTSTSTGFVDVTDPEDPRLVGVLPTRGTPDFVLWRDIKVDGDFAFIVSEITGSGLQVFDLTRLRGATGPAPQVFTSDAAYDGFSSAHNVSINTETDTAYVVGVGDGPGRTPSTTDDCTNGEEGGGVHVLDISAPKDPKFQGCLLVPDAEEPGASNNYVHDIECVVYDGPDAKYRGREICFGSNENAVVVYDATDMAEPRVLSTRTYEGAAYTHQGSLTEDHRWFLFGDELDEQENRQGTTTYVLDAKDLDRPATPKPFVHGVDAIDHNMYVHGDRVFQSNYTAGLRILEFDDDSLAAGELREVAYFDVVPGTDVAEFAGTWSNFRFPSGTTVVSAIENEVSGLFVLQPKEPAKAAGKARPARGPHEHGPDHRH